MHVCRRAGWSERALTKVDLAGRDWLLKHYASPWPRFGRKTRRDMVTMPAGDAPWGSSWWAWSAASPWACCLRQFWWLQGGSRTAGIATSPRQRRTPGRLSRCIGRAIGPLQTPVIEAKRLQRIAAACGLHVDEHRGARAAELPKLVVT